MKRLLCFLLAVLITLCMVPQTAFAVGDENEIHSESYPEFATSAYSALFAHATLGGYNAQAWQRWHKDVKGENFEKGVRYFFLPSSADDSRVELYNNYAFPVTIGDVVIEPYTSAFVDYVEGEKLVAVCNKGGESEKEYTFTVMKSDAEASVYINDTTNSYVDCNGETQETDLWSFLIQNKENSVSGSSCTIISDGSIQDTVLKKIKGRGNTNWKTSDKKPFNITFNEKTAIGDVVSKKFSLVSNSKDATLLRNALMYDFANDVGSLYASEQSFIDLYVNGVYRGSYIACQKVDMGKNSLVSLKDKSDEVNSDFNFLVEVDVWNYKLDTYFVSDQGYHVVLKTPDLEDYDETDPDRQAKYNFIKSTYQKLEDALYKGTLEDIEKICDLDSLATQYLLQEFGKNCDGGYTSTYFTYNASEGKFYAAPIWDCDSCLGAVNCMRDGCSRSTSDHIGWVTRLAKYEDTVNPLGQAFYVDGVSSENQTFEELCAEIWTNRFLPKINVLLSNAESDGRLKSIDEYVSSTQKTAYINYIMWDFAWLHAQDHITLDNEYTADYSGEIQYLKDWIVERSKWMTAMFSFALNDDSVKNVYFSTDLSWKSVFYFVWGDALEYSMDWPGRKAELVATNDEAGYALYKATVPKDINYIIFNNANNGEQTVNIGLTPDFNLYTSTNVAYSEENKVVIYNVVASYYEEPEEPTTEVTQPVPDSSSNESIPDTPPVSTVTVPGDASSAVTEPTESTTEIPPIIIPTLPIASEPSESSTVSTTAAQTDTEPVNNAILGDVNLDGKVNIKDATTLQKHLAKIIKLDENSLKVSDTNRDGKISISDATTIQKKIANLITW